ncbi:MAG: hypothetical protein VX000_16245, partial [Myxococcota bacterium]|nr:hypothetical protein [Myxococcota bacterium]
MTRPFAVLCVLVGLVGCDAFREYAPGSPEPEAGDEREARVATDDAAAQVLARPVVPDPEPMVLDVRSATVSMVVLTDGDAEVSGTFQRVTGTLT